MALTFQERRRLIEKTRKENEKEMKEEFRVKQKELEEKKKKLVIYPPTIATMAKRVKRINPFNSSLANMNAWDASLVVYFKLRQQEIPNLSIHCNLEHCWVEFEFGEKVYVFDILSVKYVELGNPIKLKYECKHEWYKQLSKTYTDIDDFMQEYDDKISLEKDEAIIKAQQDEGLNSVMLMKYY